MVAGGNPPPLGKPIHIPARGVVKTDSGELEKPEQRPAFKLGVTIALVAAGLVVCVAGFLGWKHFSNGKSPAASPNTATVTPKPEAPKVNPAPKNAVVPPVEAAPTSAPTEELAKADPAPTQPQFSLPPPLPPPQKSSSSNLSHSAPTTLAPGVTANMPVPNNGASPEFRAWVANVKISGVFQGANSRAFINGQMTRVGDPVDSRLGIIFEGIDPEKKQIIFKDATGATATRKY